MSRMPMHGDKMPDTGKQMHFVCTREELKQVVDKLQRFWVQNCGCREDRGGCKRSRTDVCLTWVESSEGSGGSGRREVSRKEVMAILKAAKEKHLVTRPFRDFETRTTVEGSCFCCDDCCGYFADPTEKCDRGQSVELTRTEGCTDCGKCVDVCYFKARRMVDGRLLVVHEDCYGCGLCRDVCTAGCIEMVPRG